jgi:O-antigen ligase
MYTNLNSTSILFRNLFIGALLVLVVISEASFIPDSFLVRALKGGIYLSLFLVLLWAIPLKSTIKLDVIKILYILVFSLLLASSITSPSLFNSYILIISSLSVVLYVYYSVYVFNVKPSRLLNIIYIGLIILVLLSIFYIVILPEFGLAYNRHFDIYRFKGVMGHANALGRVCALLIIIILFYKLNDNNSNKLILLILAGTSFYILLQTDSRAALFAMIIVCSTGIILKYFLLSKHKAILAISLLPLIFISIYVMILLLNPASFFEREVVESITRSGNVEELTTFTGRIDVWLLYFDYISQNPLIGYGYQVGDHYMREAARMGYSGFVTTHAHNMYIEIAFSSGLIGLLLYLTMLFLVVTRLSKLYILTRNNIYFTCLLIMIYIMIVSLFERGAYGNITLLFIITTIITSFNYEPKKSIDVRPSS